MLEKTLSSVPEDPENSSLDFRLLEGTGTAFLEIRRTDEELKMQWVMELDRLEGDEGRQLLRAQLYQPYLLLTCGGFHDLLAASTAAATATAASGCDAGGTLNPKGGASAGNAAPAVPEGIGKFMKRLKKEADGWNTSTTSGVHRSEEGRRVPCCSSSSLSMFGGEYSSSSLNMFGGGLACYPDIVTALTGGTQDSGRVLMGSVGGFEDSVAGTLPDTCKYQSQGAEAVRRKARRGSRCMIGALDSDDEDHGGEAGGDGHSSLVGGRRAGDGISQSQAGVSQGRDWVSQGCREGVPQGLEGGTSQSRQEKVSQGVDGAAAAQGSGVVSPATPPKRIVKKANRRGRR
eukprot:GHVU01020606.1.p1 GENE.GHVU01020606.1~~GHVU01020606.1.p1  ORF type:complete len:346 (-),score=39.47 GHVU01020606.1:395-1432(-)